MFYFQIKSESESSRHICLHSKQNGFWSNLVILEITLHDKKGYKTWWFVDKFKRHLKKRWKPLFKNWKRFRCHLLILLKGIPSGFIFKFKIGGNKT